MFEWDEANAGHSAEHHVSIEEAEQALLDPRRIGVPAYNVEDEIRQAFLGAAESGRVLYVVLTHREGAIRVVTARDASDQQRGRYQRRR